MAGTIFTGKGKNCQRLCAKNKIRRLSRRKTGIISEIPLESFSNGTRSDKILEMQRIYIKDIKDKIGETVNLAGWVDVRRDHGKLIFIDLRDTSGKMQTVIVPKSLDNGE